MSVISISISESSEQIISGIPKSISLSSNIPSTIFYTLDGSAPNTFSAVYTSAIILPTNSLLVVLSVFATNGIDSSSIIVKQYKTNIVDDDVRLPHSAVTNLNNSSSINSLYPFGTNSPNPTYTYLNPANTGTTVSDSSTPITSTGFDSSGAPTGFINQPIEDYPIIFSTTNPEGEVKPGVGTLPTNTKIIGKTTPVEYTQEQSSRADRIFNPKALVIYQDSTTEDPLQPVLINRQFFSLENPEVVRDGNLLYNAALDSPPTMGAFIKSHYNPRTNMITYYYRDPTVNRWIISSTPYEPKDPNAGALYSMVFSRPGAGCGFVFKWMTHYYRTLI